MQKVRCFRKQRWLFGVATAGVVLFAVLAMPIPVAFTGDENINVSCYRGNQGEGEYLGTVMAFSPESAGQKCNSLYYSCNGKCYGCFSDFDLSEDVCYDNAGRKFLK